MVRLGVIGMGRRSAHLTALMMKADTEVRLAALADPARKMADERMAEVAVDGAAARRFDSAEALLENADQLDALLIGSNCDSHAALAIKCAETRLPLFMEKPVATTRAQLSDLAAAFAGRDANVVVSFPLRMSPLMQRVLQLIKSGRLGVVNQVQAFNYVPYGGVYFGQWYRDFDVTGGLWLQKATHDFDYINQIVQATPLAVAATGSQRVFGGEMAPDLMCSACDRTETCPESPRSIAERGDDGGMGTGDHACAFSSSIRHHDSGSALITYSNGVHAAYSQNFVSRRSAAWRGARVTGYRATLQFDWYKEAATIIDHHQATVEEIKFTDAESHHGGDGVLVRNFVNVIRREDASHSTLANGILSAAMCLAAQRSEEAGTFEPITIPSGTRERTDSAAPRNGLRPSPMRVHADADHGN